MRLVTAKQMRDADAYTIETLGVPSQTLMERAGQALAEKACEMINGKSSVAVFCGGGNNGGDGFVCARILHEKGVNVRVVCTAQKFSEDCEIQKEKYLLVGGEIIPQIDSADLIIDCLLGTGFCGVPREETARQIEKINALKRLGAKVLSADVPSGLDGTSGLQNGCVFADETLCIGEVKLGAILQDGLDVCGKISRADIGISLCEEPFATRVEKEFVAEKLPQRKRNTHKGNYGSAVILGGSKTYLGAPYLSALAAQKSGAGYTVLAVPKGIFQYYVLKSPELLLKTVLGEDEIQFSEKELFPLLSYSSIAFGMGATTTQDVAQTAAWLIENYTGKLVLDADALNALSCYGKEALETPRKCDLVLTPHVKEFSRLTGYRVQEVKENGAFLAKEYAARLGCTVLLKGASTIVTDGNSVAVVDRGSAGQAKGGSGDVLSGLIAGLCAQGLSGFDAAACGGWLTGVSAERAAAELGEYSLTATDVIAKLPQAFFERF